MRDTYHRTQLSLRGEVSHTDGLATRHSDFTEGHVTIYTDGAGAVTISSDSVLSLRSLGAAFHRAANELDAMRAVEVSA